MDKEYRRICSASRRSVHIMRRIKLFVLCNAERRRYMASSIASSVISFCYPAGHYENGYCENHDDIANLLIKMGEKHNG